jgi:phospholipid/cholesterol/gamma-HCH transport system substrate-binding protein
MMTSTRIRIGLAAILVFLTAAAGVVALHWTSAMDKIHVVAYFENSNGIFVGDEVRILGVPVGKIDRIEPRPDHAEISFWYDEKYEVPASAKAVILSPSLVTARAIQLTPAYTGGPVMVNEAVINRDRTAVPVEFDDFRAQLRRLTNTLQPNKPGGVSTLGSLINTAADNLRGRGASIRDTVVKLSQTLSALGDHSDDIFGTVKDLATLVSALQDSTNLMAQLNRNLDTVTGLLADDPAKVANALKDLNAVIGEVQSFVADNKESLGTSSDKLASITRALTDSLDDIKQTLHIAPTVFANLSNVWYPAQGAITGELVLNNFANPISFLCGAIQAASRLGAAQSAKLCVQYLAPIIKNRQYSFPPLGENLFVGEQARPNEVTYSEDWLRPDYIPPQPPPASPPAPAAPNPPEPRAPSPLVLGAPPPAAEAPSPTHSSGGLLNLMMPPGPGS